MTRRQLMALAASYGATLTERARADGSRAPWIERRDLYPQGVASGDPHPDSVILWTRRPPVIGNRASVLKLEVAKDAQFRRVVARADAPVSEETDWTCRVLASDLKPDSVYWYRFSDEHGYGTRIGRTITAPSAGDPRPVRFAFVSCQNVQQGASTAYRRMIWEDRRSAPGERLGFVMHLGDFIYEIVWYPEDRPQGMYARRIRDIVRYAHGEKHRDFHVPTTVDDYRAVYKAYLLDPDLQDARAYLPFIYMWDNHEFSWKCWQSQQNFGDGAVPAQTRKVAACQAWYEYQPSRGVRANGSAADLYTPPAVKDAPLDRFDASGTGLDAGNLAAIHSLKLYRTLHWGRNVDLILTDNRSFRSEPLVDRKDYLPFRAKGSFEGSAIDALEILDAGRTWAGGHPPDRIEFGGAAIENPRKNSPAQSMLGAQQKAWFCEQLRGSKAAWKLWGNSVAALDWRIDYQNLPADIGAVWPAAGYGVFTDDDWSGYRAERAEILDFVKREKIGGFASLAGDRHAFTAGVLSASLPPRAFEPVGIEFITGSVSAPGLFEALEYALPEDDTLKPLYAYRARTAAAKNATNLSLMHGVRASLALHRTGDLSAAMAASNAEVSPHLSFVDTGGHGYTVVRASADALEAEFVCIPRPIESSGREDGGPLAYRVTHRAKLWEAGARPKLERTSQDGELPVGA